MSRKRFSVFSLLTAALMVMVTGCQSASESVDNGTLIDENITQSADDVDIENNEETESESMQDEQKDMIAEAIKQETASVGPEIDNSQNVELLRKFHIRRMTILE
ncbi:MAG: hypothetical protein K2J25_07545, partial [Oscillospiraceae bacterium]|nr:hypothetical protein [Oscillospiraceae bacterium]